MKKFILIVSMFVFSFSLIAKEKAKKEQNNKEKTYKETVIKNPVKGSPEWVIQKAIGAAMAKDFYLFYNNYCHPSLCAGTGKNKADMKRFMWHRFTKWAPSYFVNKKQKTFEVVYTVPKTFDEKTKQIKFFIKSSKRDSPAPIIIKKDKDGRYKVYNSSL